ncbi:MAG: hypothetical protein WAU81_02135 [Candidatus Aminicenantales bacterium]
MKRNSLAFLLLPLFLMSCGGDTYRKVRLELPTYSTLHPDEFQGVILTNFLIVNAPEGFDLNRELAAFFVPEFERKLGLPVTVQPVRLESEESIRRPDFWQTLSPGSPRRLYVTGNAELTREIRKSILGEVPGEDPFSPQRKIAERILFSLSLHLFLVQGDNGEVLLDRDFKETKTYTSPKQRTDFAFHDLALRIKTKLFRLILNEERIQERYLLLK